MGNILKVENLRVVFSRESKEFNAVDDVSFTVEAGKITCLVGQSGSGKSMTALSIIKMLPSSAKLNGSVMYNEKNLLVLPTKELVKIRGKRIYTIFQNPMNALNPSVKIGKQLFYIAKSHGISDRKTFDRQIAGILEELNFCNSGMILEQYPFQLSGGMLQRVMIALAIWMKPEIIIADEPTTALDVTVQKEILNQFRRIRDVFGVTILLITHDFGVVAELADEVVVMYKGKIVEKSNVFKVFNSPKELYTKELLKATFDKEVGTVC